MDVTPYSCMSRPQLEHEYQSVLTAYESCKAQKLNLNMARGKPSVAQLDLVSGLLTQLLKPEDCFDGTIDARNYGELAGLPCARAYWADVLGCKPSQVFVGGAASLNMMSDVVSRAFTHGLLHSPRPWCKEERVKFLCPSPGYDRHFQIGEFYGAELIYVPMTPTGPDMDVVEEYVKDPQVKMIWLVPKYSNPDGIIFSDETIRRFAQLKPAAPDFAIIWDNAYCIHEFEGEYVPFPDIISMCAQAGRPDMVYEFASTSKITFAGGGICCNNKSGGVIENCVVLGAITSTPSRYPDVHNGAFAVNNEGTIRNCLADKETSGLQYAAGQQPDTLLDMLKTTAEMKSAATYGSAFDTEIWNIENGQYPALRKTA